jgi:hypothetical protein
MGKPPSKAPLVTRNSFTITGAVFVGQIVGRMSATNNPNQWSLSGSDCFGIDRSGVITVTQIGGLNDCPSDVTYALTVTAINKFGTGSGAAIVYRKAYVGTIIINPPSDPWISQDGRDGAPAGPAQYPTLLNNYVASGSPRRERAINGSYSVSDPGRRQPPWMVAGVDYRVGIRSNPVAVSIGNGTISTEFQNFVNAIVAAGGSVSFNTAASTITISNRNGSSFANPGVDLSNSGVGWDFTSASGTGGTRTGWFLQFTNCSWIVIRDCRFKMPAGVGTGTNLISPTTNGSSFNFDIQYNEFTAQAGALGNGAFGSSIAIGQLIFQYNWVYDTPQQVLNVANNQSITYKYNLLTNITHWGTSIVHMNYLIHQTTGLGVITMDNFLSHGGGSNLIWVQYRPGSSAEGTLNTGDYVHFSGVVGTGNVDTLSSSPTNQTPLRITKQASDTFTLDAVTWDGAASYTSGAVVRRADGATGVQEHNVQFNTTYQEPNISGGEGFQFHARDTNRGDGYYASGPTIANNTMICRTTSTRATVYDFNATYSQGDIVTSPNPSVYTYYVTGNGGAANGVAQPSFMGTPISAIVASPTSKMRLTIGDATFLGAAGPATCQIIVAGITGSYAGLNAVWSKANVTVVNATTIDINTAFFAGTLAGAGLVGANMQNSVQNGSESNYLDAATGGTGQSFGSFGGLVWTGQVIPGSVIANPISNMLHGNITPTTAYAATANSAIGTTTVTLNSVAGLVVNDSYLTCGDNNAIPQFSFITNIAGNVVTLSNAIVAPGISTGNRFLLEFMLTRIPNADGRITGNFFDREGAAGIFYGGNDGWFGWQVSENIDMRTGGTVSPANGD